MKLPIDAIRADVSAALDSGPVVVSSPTGSGKSTQIPRWCAARGRVLVVEPRRVACRSLAERVAELEGTKLGDRVGYRVRDDDRSGLLTQVLFATPGIVLRMITRSLDDFAVVILDEFHERSLDVDLILALLVDRFQGDLLVMSATLDGDAVARYIKGRHLTADGRTFPVEIQHLSGPVRLPDGRGVERRVIQALRNTQNIAGDVLVFLPGKAEIRATQHAIEGTGLGRAVPLHGGLSLEAQRAAFRPMSERKIILATNVAETSLTVPGVTVVIDSGLVRRTRYHNGRGYLTLLPIAMDSADQRAGRAGRTQAGICVRLWSEQANLASKTPPEIHRDSLVPLVLAAAACDAKIEGLAFFDAPKPHAVESAEAELTALGALDEGEVTSRGRTLFGLPLDPGLGRLLVEADGTDAIDDVIDLVAVLATGRQLFAPGGRPSMPEDDLRAGGCDAVAAIRALREGHVEIHKLRWATINDARRIAKRLRRAFGRRETRGTVNRRQLALILLRADPRLAHVARRRKRAMAWSNGGTELELGRDCALSPTLDTTEGQKIDAVLVLDSRAIGKDQRKTRLVITAAMPVPLDWLRAAGVGRDQVRAARIRKGRLVADVERIHAGKVLSTREVTPEGQVARDAFVRCFLEGRLWPKSLAITKERLSATGLQARLDETSPPLPLEAWVAARIAELGMESGDDLALLDPTDLEAPALPDSVQAKLDATFPRMVKLSDVTYEVHYDIRRRVAVLKKVSGRRREPPPGRMLPKFKGFRIEVHHRHVVYQVRR